MGKIAWNPGDHVYLDTNLFIYAVEAIDPYAEKVSHLLQAADRAEITLVTSLLTLAETLVLPFRKGDDLLVGIYRDLFLHPPPGLLVIQLNAGILERAAKLRATISSLRLPDAIHLATAESEHCDLILTNDKRFSSSTTVRVAVLSDGSDSPSGTG